MEVRDPQALLPQLVNTCVSSGIADSKTFSWSIQFYLFVSSKSSEVWVSTGVFSFIKGMLCELVGRVGDGAKETGNCRSPF